VQGRLQDYDVMMNSKPKYELVEVNVGVTFVDVMNSCKYRSGDDANTATKR